MSSLNIGDLALTLVGDAALEAGSVVTLVARINPGDLVTPSFRAPSHGWFCAHEHVKADVLAFADYELMPLRPTPQELKEVEHEQVG